MLSMCASRIPVWRIIVWRDIDSFAFCFDLHVIPKSTVSQPIPILTLYRNETIAWFAFNVGRFRGKFGRTRIV